MKYGLISDIHSNLEALEVALENLCPAEAFLCLGDLVGYGPDPNACVARVRQLPNLICIVGNHDLAAIGRYDLNWFNPFAREAIEWTARQLEPENLGYLASLPLMQELPPFTLVHGALPNPMDYVLSQWEARQTIAEMTTPSGLIGHTHIAEYYIQPTGNQLVGRESLFSGGEISLEDSSRYLVNCGSVGQPRDGNPKVACGLYDDETHVITLYRLEYDIQKTQQKMKSAGLPEFLAQRLPLGH